MSKCVVELSVPNSDIRIYVEGMHFSNREFGSNDEYYYNEHTCPTNYLRHIIRVQNGDDDDPHGVFPYVRTIDWDKFQASRICTLQ